MPYDHPFQDRIRLDPSWPGTHSGGQEIHADPDLLDTLGQRLIGQANGMTSSQSYLPSSVSYFEESMSSTTVGLRNATQVPEGAQLFGGWPTAVLMEHSLACAQSDIVYYYERLMEQVGAAGRLFKATADSYRALDEGVSADLSQLGGWDQLLDSANAGGQAQEQALLATAPPASGSLHEFAEIPYIDQYEEVGQYDPNWVLEQIERLRSLQPWGQLQSMGNAFDSAGDRLESLSTMLRNCAGSLDGEWESETSVACQKALRQITATAEHLATSCHQLSDFSFRSAETIQETVSGFPTEVEGRSIREWLQDTATIGDSPNLDAKHDEIRDSLARLNDSYRTINYSTLPAEVGANLPLLPTAPNDGRNRTESPHERPGTPAMPVPPVSTPTPPLASTGGPSGQGLPIGTGITGFQSDTGASTTTAAASLSGGAGVSGFPVTPAGAESADLDSATGGLAGVGPQINPSAANPAAGAPLGGAPAGGGGPNPLNASGLPAGIGGITGGRGAAGGTPPLRGGRPAGIGVRPASGVMPVGSSAANGRDGARGAQRGSALAGRGPGAGGQAQGGGAGARSRAGGSVLPMSGRKGDGEDEHHRDTWLQEDQDPWGKDESVPPPVIR